MARSIAEFQTIYSEGGLLPPDLLRRLIDPKGDIPGLRAEDYGLPKGDRLNDAIAQSWNVLRRHWSEFRSEAKKLSKDDHGTGLTNDKWTIPLLRELGFGMLPSGTGQVAAGRTYAISRMFGNTPVHLVGCGLSLDRRTAGARGAAMLNPHGLVQEFLNRKPESLWGIVSNGLEFRLLRDSQALSRQSYLEFDLDAMFIGEIYSDFVVLWLTAHATRFQEHEANKAESCWLEEWTIVAAKDGTRILGDLRQGVEKALETLGQGFVGHPQNHGLRDALRSGALSLSDFHAQLLRVVYRLIFLFVAEDRVVEGEALLHPRDDSPAAVAARGRFRSYYSTKRLRRIASDMRGSRHGDLWSQFHLLVEALSGSERSETARRWLALPALGGFLWAPSSTPSLHRCSLANGDFLEAIRRLAFTKHDRSLRPVDYRNLGAEELGGVYEGLLALTPRIGPDGKTFSFAELAGNERKTSGSYYTPDSLVQNLLDSALDPIVQQVIQDKRGTEAEQAILGLKVCDPAVGSGHFLVGAAHRLARHLAQVRAAAGGESQPSPLLYQHALREVIGRCLYGVDVNPMAAELCRVSLWLEALEPGKPLSFLDHHIRVGNSLLGAMPALIATGLPDETFTAMEGDDRKACAVLKKRSRVERNGMGPLFAAEQADTQATIQQAAAALEQLPDDRPEEVREKELAFRRHEETAEYLHKKRLADAWCSAFFIQKQFTEAGRDGSAYGITQRDLNAIASGGSIPTELSAEIDCLARDFQFFHWYLAFPEVFARGGFDCVLGNPPWDKIQPEEEKFFAGIRPDIALATSAAKRKALIEDLASHDPVLDGMWHGYKRQIDATCHFLRSSGSMPLSGQGNLNSYRVFTELAARLVAQVGRAGLVAQTGLATDESGKELFDHLLTTGRLLRFLDFENRKQFFADVHQQFRFCLVTIGGIPKQPARRAAEFGWLLHSLAELEIPGRLVHLTAADLILFNPTSRTSPVFTSAQDFAVSRRIYRSSEHVMLDADHRFGGVDFLGELFNMTRDSGLFSGSPAGDTLPLYEAKFIHQFDHRFASVRNGTVCEVTATEKTSLDGRISPKSWVEEATVMSRAATRDLHTRWMAGFRDIASPTNERTSIAAVFPFAAVGNSINLIRGLSGVETALLVANANAFAFDFCARQKISGSHVNIWIFKQLPAIPLQRFGVEAPWASARQTIQEWVLVRTLELCYSSSDLRFFAEDCGWSGPPFRWDDERRFLLRCELDAGFFHLYLEADKDGSWSEVHGESTEELARLRTSFPTPRDAAGYIMDAFPIVRRRDEEAFAGDFRTKRVILEIYDAMAEAVRSRRPYQTRLDPPPAALRLTHESALAVSTTEGHVPDNLPDLAWALPESGHHDATLPVLAALLKIQPSPTSTRTLRLAAVFALEPRLLTPLLDTNASAEWRRLIGPDAESLPRGVQPFAPKSNAAWGAAVKQLRGTGRLVENLADDTWAPGPKLQDVETGTWPDGRARFVVQAISAQGFDSLVGKLPEAVRAWVNAEAA